MKGTEDEIGMIVKATAMMSAEIIDDDERWAMKVPGIRAFESWKSNRLSLSPGTLAEQREGRRSLSLSLPPRTFSQIGWLLAALFLIPFIDFSQKMGGITEFVGFSILTQISIIISFPYFSIQDFAHNFSNFNNTTNLPPKLMLNIFHIKFIN